MTCRGNRTGTRSTCSAGAETRKFVCVFSDEHPPHHIQKRKRYSRLKPTLLVLSTWTPSLGVKLAPPPSCISTRAFP
jgi:hypothetical protein